MKNYTTEEILTMIDTGEKLVLDFNAPWCGPCVAFSPIFEKISKEEEFSKISFIKINVDENAELSMKYNVRNIPTIILIENGIAKNKKVGAISEVSFKEFLKS